MFSGPSVGFWAFDPNRSNLHIPPLYLETPVVISILVTCVYIYMAIYGNYIYIYILNCLPLGNRPERDDPLCAVYKLVLLRQLGSSLQVRLGTRERRKREGLVPLTERPAPNSRSEGFSTFLLFYSLYLLPTILVLES